MLADIIIHRSALGSRLNNEDLHRHATFYCAVQRAIQRLRRLVGLA